MSPEQIEIERKAFEADRRALGWDAERLIRFRGESWFGSQETMPTYRSDWTEGQWLGWLARAASAPVAPSTPSSHWKAEGEPDPHDSRYYDQERATLCMGNLTDDELANLAFMNYDRHLSVAEMVAGKPTPIVWMTAVKDRIRWLSRALEKALAHPPAVQPVAPAGWKPIETAPSTGAVLLAVECGGERKTFFAEQSHEQNGPCWYITTGWCGWSRLHNSWTPVAWSQIPATPSAEAQPTPKEN